MTPKLKRTLYIGLGGTGFKTLLHTKRAFIETYGEVPPMIKFLIFDSDQNEYKNYKLPSIYGDITFDPAESSDIMVKQAASKVSKYRNELSWLPERNHPAVVDLVNGCGMVRTNGRVAFSFNYEKSRSNIRRALNSVCHLSTIRDDKYDLLSQDVDVNIVFSIAGGTGSGNFLDTAYLVKDIMKEQALPETSKIIGYMVLPDVYDAQLTFGKERLKPNACGSLVDLDYLMHLPYYNELPVNYLTEQRVLHGTPFNTLIAIGNRNHNGDVVSQSEDLSEMMSLAMVVSAGELSSGMASVANNLERDMNSGDFNIGNKRAIIGTLGMSEITFRATELSTLYRAKAARELASSLLSRGSNVDNVANAWIDTEHIRENNGQDQVIDFLLNKMPGSVMQDVYDKANPKADIDNYRNLNNVRVDPNQLTAKVEELEKRIKTAFENKITELTDSFGPVYAIEFIKAVRTEIDICLGEMRSELEGFQNAVTAKESAVRTAIEEYKAAQKKFFGKAKAVQDAVESLCACVTATVINDREIGRRNGAITFYTWLMQEMATTETRLQNIKQAIKGAIDIIDSKIGALKADLIRPRGIFEVDLTQPYINQVEVSPTDISINQFLLTLPENERIHDFYNVSVEKVADYLLGYTAKLTSGALWESMSVEDALAKLPQKERENVIHKAIDLSSPMCPLDFRGHISKPLNNYYYIGVAEQSTSGLNGDIIDVKAAMSGSEMHETYLASIGSRDRIVFYHQYGVFPTFAIAGTESYRHAHDRYMENPTAYSCFIDEDLRRTMERESFSVLPKERGDDSMELWVKGLIFGLISRDDKGVYQYKDESNDDAALDGYVTSLGTPYRDEAFRNFKRESARLQPQYEQLMAARSKAEGQDAIDIILADAKLNYLDKYSLNDLSKSELGNSLYKNIKDQLNAELKFVKNEL